MAAYVGSDATLPSRRETLEEELEEEEECSEVELRSADRFRCSSGGFDSHFFLRV